MTDIGFSPNFTHLYEIDITPNEATPTRARIGAGITKIDPDPSETVSESEYYDGDGVGSADVTGAKWNISLEGERDYNDPFQNWAASLKFSFGQSRRTHAWITSPNGEVIESEVTVANIKPFGGDANAKATFSCNLYFNGLPKATGTISDTLPDKVEAADVNVNVGATAEISPTVEPTNAPTRCVYAVDDNKVATVSATGLVTGVAEGETEISIKCAAKPSVQKTIKVKVKAAASGASTQKA